MGNAPWEVEAEVSKLVLEGVVAELRVIPSRAQLVSPVVAERSSMRNSHLRDAAIKFEEEGHRYILHPGTPMATTFPISVSGLWGQYFDRFDAVATIWKYYKKWSERPD